MARLLIRAKQKAGTAFFDILFHLGCCTPTVDHLFPSSANPGFCIRGRSARCLVSSILQVALAVKRISAYVTLASRKRSGFEFVIRWGFVEPGEIQCGPVNGAPNSPRCSDIFATALTMRRELVFREGTPNDFTRYEASCLLALGVVSGKRD